MKKNTILCGSIISILGENQQPANKEVTYNAHVYTQEPVLQSTLD